ncbi:MAG: cation diffusion facilitator family transporter [Candidatus Limivicinus sp.]
MTDQQTERGRIIIRYNAAGIVMNLLLSVFKLMVGLVIHSRAVMLDALNGFSDMLSSFVSMLSTLYAGRRTDRQHPFGYGRLEYITSLFTTVFILFLALHELYGAITEILSKNDSAPEYNTAVVVLMSVSLIAKLAYGFLSRKTGRRINSVALIMSGTESIGDSVVSFAILVTIAIYRATGLDLEPWLSILISLFIIKTGFDMTRECVNKLLGKKSDPAAYISMKKQIAQEPGVRNVFNLVIHNYGEELAIGSVDIVVDETMTAADTTKLVRRIRRRAAESGITLSSVGVYGSSIQDEESAALWDKVLHIVRSHPEFLRAHAFSYDSTERSAFFVVILDPSVQKKDSLVDALTAELNAAFPGISFTVEAALDI